MKVMAGSIASSWSRSITSTRRGVKNRRRGRPRDGCPRTWSASSSSRLGLGVRAAVDQGRQQVEVLAALVADAVEVLELDRAPLLDHRLRRARARW